MKSPALILIGCVAFSMSSLMMASAVVADPKPQASFHWFDYQGQDPVFAEPLAKGEYQNPMAAGFFPDPSITRKGDDYYIAVSSFAYTPGLPILHSRDLVNWQLIGHALNRSSQTEFSGLQISRGIFAPTLRYHDGLFYLITTAVDSGGNFIITAEDPAGPWSDPVWLPEIDGIDPDIFFDDDGRVYITHNGPPPDEPLYEGHRAIWLWEYDPETQTVLPESRKLIVNGGVDLSKQPIWIEAPHLFRHQGWYYLLCAEGGTGYNHSAVMFRTRSLDKPFEPYSGNPILTQRDLEIDRPDPVTTAGHADFVQLPDGQWWAIFLATRAYQQTYYNTGRESFLLPVNWQNGWPHILPAGEPVPYRPDTPRGLPQVPVTEPLTGNFSWRDNFDGKALNVHWNLLREFDRSWLNLDQQRLLLQAKSAGLDSMAQPAFVARRQQHMHFTASTALSLPEEGMSAGIAAFQNESYHFYLGVRADTEGYQVFLERAGDGEPEQVASQQIQPSSEPVRLKVEGKPGQIKFLYSIGSGDWHSLGGKQDGKLLSTEVAGGFVGTMLGLHARLETGE
ncbi:glycoside hydrolase family 43 protein [Lacimicrobium alkaliphilum]|uniref:Beta-xylosidase C-terminal Concanavalin A-like domain-containing protein n=1 Tax=Lacimicrobium alkaliphilum TaxID=1526571 RepID=A0A0U3AMA3_9ALTE|nr:glycoside hydrolase family 43 protein [Lacimicrobium alkaliphilum]ALS99905.1 hypothetical protein AT746_17625 [Lacimicrobium alkaliphilum]